jgi:hypothetical protein
MAVAGTPPNTSPSSPRATSSKDQLGAVAQPRLSSAAAHIEPNIRPRRPSVSENAPMARIEIASAPVVDDSASELAAASRWNSRANSASSGWTL